jgi:hypothetical protein
MMQPRDGHPVATSGDVLLITPPFASIDRPSLGLHIVQSITRQAGLRANVYYATVHAAAHLGEARYAEVAYSAPLHLLGERVFSPAAFPDTTFATDLYASANRRCQLIRRSPNGWPSKLPVPIGWPRSTT